MKAAGITLSTVGAGGGANPFLEQLAKQGGGRFYAAANPASIPDIFLKETQQVAGQQIVEEPFHPILTSQSPILRGIDAGLPPAPRLQRHDGQVGRADGPRHAARRPAPRPVAVRARTVGGVDVGLDRSLGEELARLERVLEVLQPARRVDVPGRGDRRHRGHVRSPRATRRGCGSRASTEDGSPRDFYSTAVAVIGAGPDAEGGRPVQVAPGRLRGAARRDRLRAPTRSASRRRGRASTPLGPDASGSSRRPPAEYRAARARTTPFLAALCGRRPAGGRSTLPADPWIHDLHDDHAARPTSGRCSWSWRCSCGRSTSRCGASRSGGASSPTRGAGWAAGWRDGRCAPRTARSRGCSRRAIARPGRRRGRRCSVATTPIRNRSRRRHPPPADLFEGRSRPRRQRQPPRNRRPPQSPHRRRETGAATCRPRAGIRTRRVCR